MITLLCSYGVLVYEILHRERTYIHDATYGLLSLSNATAVATVINNKLEDTIYANISLDLPHF